MRISSSSSPSNSNSNSRSSSTSINYINDQTKSSLVPKTMEEVWKDINDLHGHPSSTAATGVILQDFFSRCPPPSAAVPSSRFAPSPPPPPTLLTLNSSTLPHNHFNPLIMHHHHHHHHRYNPDISHDNAGGGKKRFPADSDRNHRGDRHHKRMIKNRESAARSRARKQAYTNELESEVAQLLEENARLKKKHEELCIIAATTAQNQKNKCLHRTSTAPF